MPEPIIYEIELNGNVGTKLLRPLIDDFHIVRSKKDVTRLIGNITDASHLHGIVTHLASMNIEIISITRPLRQDNRPESTTRQETNPESPLQSSPHVTYTKEHPND
ncbi:MAG: hypothetical protein GXP35_09375 [Actinobacteria bacterium]|nr:hypothetical protein [Actinomycetota bacterium]